MISLSVTQVVELYEKIKQVQLSDFLKSYCENSKTLSKEVDEIPNSIDLKDVDSVAEFYSKLNKAFSRIDLFRGSCPQCGGRMRERSGAFFQGQYRCVPCGHICR